MVLVSGWMKLFQNIQMIVAAQAFQKGNDKEAITIYTSIIDQDSDNASEALLNRASAYYSIGEYAPSLKDCTQYLRRTQPNVQGYIIYANSLIKTKGVIGQKQREILDRGKTQYPYHKKYLDTLKILEELQITQNQEEYLDRIFEKLLSVPPIRQYMTEEPFLTKVQKMITNPSLASALIKMDGRLAEVQEIILMADA